MNITPPTSSVLLTGLAIMETNFSRWFRVGFKISAILTLVSTVLLYIATPFQL